MCRFCLEKCAINDLDSTDGFYARYAVFSIVGLSLSLTYHPKFERRARLTFALLHNDDSLSDLSNALAHDTAVVQSAKHQFFFLNEK
jgi:hypothetical protein